MKPSVVCLLIAAILASSCATNTSRLPPNSPVSIGANETVVVLGVVPSYEVLFLAGIVDKDNWSDDKFSLSGGSNFPENGYIVAKISSLSEGKAYALARIMPRGLAGRIFWACRADKVLAFQAPAGRVIYVGDVNYDLDLQTGDTLGYGRSTNPDKARQFLASYYPDLASKMETQETKELAVATMTLCDIRTPVAVGGAMMFIPRHQRAHPPGTYVFWE